LCSVYYDCNDNNDDDDDDDDAGGGGDVVETRRQDVECKESVQSHRGTLSYT